MKGFVFIFRWQEDPQLVLHLYAYYSQKTKAGSISRQYTLPDVIMKK